MARNRKDDAIAWLDFVASSQPDGLMPDRPSVISRSPIMGIVSQGPKANVVNVRYSAFLGMLYVSNETTEAAIAAIKAQIGEEVVKQGFVGLTPDGASGRARNSLRDAGISPVSLVGELRTVRLVKRETSGGVERQYLNLGVRDADGRYFLSVDLSSKSTQMLVRKLANAVPGVETKVSMFATYGKKPGKDRAYADHGVSLVQGDSEIKGIDPQAELSPRREFALQQLRKIPGVAQAVLNAQAASIELDFHRELLEGIESKFDAFYGTTESQGAPSVV
jgi:hypothetical protein